MVNPSAAAGTSAKALLRLLVALLAVASLVFSTANAGSGGTVGVNFGQTADDIPAPDVVLKLVQSTSIHKIKLYGADPTVLTAFAGTGIDFVIGAGNELIETLATPTNSSPSPALQWLQTNIVAYPNTSIVGVALGNEVLSYEPTLMPLLLPAMQNVHTALVSLGLDQKVLVSSPHSMGIVAESFPPSDGEFHYIHGQILSPMLDFFAQTGAPFMVNVYPYFAYTTSPTNISIDYVLFSPDAVPVHDPGSGLDYTNMFDAQVDAVYAAISKLGYNNVSIAVTETGWPSAGDSTELGASVANAQLYNWNLVKHIESGVGTPAKPSVTPETYIFALYNEDQKPGPVSERNFGLYLPDGTPVYKSGLAVSPQWYSSPPPPVAYFPPYPPPPVVTISPYPPPVGVYSPPPPVVTISPYPPPVGVYSPPPPVAPISPYPPPVWYSPPPPPPPVAPIAPYPPPVVYSPPPPPPVAPIAPYPPPVVYSPPPPPPVAPIAPYPPPAVYSPPPPPPVVVGYSPPPPPVPYSPPPPSFFSPPPPPTPTIPDPPAFPDPPAPTLSPFPPPAVVNNTPPPPVSGGSPPPPPVTPAPTTSPVAPIAPAAPGPGGPGSWCVANPATDAAQLQIALNWACGEGGANCSAIQVGASCYLPNTLVLHSSYAFNSYYAIHSRNYWDCFFSNTAMITYTNPGYVNCTYT